MKIPFLRQKKAPLNAQLKPKADLTSLEAPGHLGVVGQGMLNNNALLKEVLRSDIRRWYPWSYLSQSEQWPKAFIGWGQKKSFQRASRAARRCHVPVLSIEDGFLRSLDTGTASRFGMSVVVDDLGIYFDSSRASRLEQLIVEGVHQGTSAQSDFARSMMTKICDQALSKYNLTLYCPRLDTLAPAARSSVFSGLRGQRSERTSHILLIDQIQGDASVSGAGASRHHFQKMLKVACQNHPEATIWIKAHPAGKLGYLTALRLPKNVQVLSEAVNSIELLKQVDHVYTVSSHMGFEALMLGKSVHCFGVSWYSGWGLTDDAHAPRGLLTQVQKRRCQHYALDKKSTKRIRIPGLNKSQCKATVEQLFFAAYIQYSHYVDPASRQACELPVVIDWLVTNRRWQHKLSSTLSVFEFSRWKVAFVKAFLNLPNTQVFIKPKPRLKNWCHPNHFRINYQQPVLVWGLEKRQQLERRWQNNGQSPASIYCMEDGFIRSNGLGATLLAPLSVVIDKQGIYYDATQPSDLEEQLRDCPRLTIEQQHRVQALWQQLLDQRVSKYNVGNTKALDELRLPQGDQKPRLLVVGQVEDDLSVQYCASSIKTNSALIRRVRQDYPQAYLIYKPHPDVEAGLRTGKVDNKTLSLVDSVAHKIAMPDCLEIVDEVHTISSLTGFEALLRGRKVICYGLPFYAGWGLTEDIDAHLTPKRKYLQRRDRKIPLTIEQLIYCALIQYPLYRLPEGYGLAQVEQVIDYLYPKSGSADKPIGHKACGSDSEAWQHAKACRSNSIFTTWLPDYLAAGRHRLNIEFMKQRRRWLERQKRSIR